MMKYWLALSLILNFLIAWWGHRQVEMGKQIVANWESRDQQRRDSIQILAKLVINKATKAEVTQVLNAARPHFFDKEGKLEAGL